MPTNLPDPQPSPSRRTLLRTAGTAAWAAPVIVAVSAAPAMATSTGGPAGTAQFNPGNTQAVIAEYPGEEYFYRALQFRSAGVTAVGGDIAVGALSFTVTFTPTAGNPRRLYNDVRIPGYTFTAIGSQAPNSGTFTITNTVPIASGETLAFSSTDGADLTDQGAYGGVYFESQESDGAFALTFTAGGSSTTTSFWTAGAPMIQPGPAAP